MYIINAGWIRMCKKAPSCKLFAFLGTEKSCDFRYGRLVGRRYLLCQNPFCKHGERHCTVGEILWLGRVL